ncbi:MAG: TlyA family RNA methyltransferase, partial [Victivallales bacterium]|nr:TlyA family RNA methyltransferase [Victivallales bacterium]
RDGCAQTRSCIDDSLQLNVLQDLKYVSRGAYKLLPAIEKFQPELEGKTALDLGASTGGFTDVLLQHGVAKVYAVDVGTDQLHPKLAADPRVVNLQKTNARQLSRELIPDPIDILVGDVSFISLTKVLPPCQPLLAPYAWIAVLVKPQFETERENIGKHGVVKDDKIRQQRVEKILAFAQSELHWINLDVIPSPILGPEGNQEFIAVFQNKTTA